MYLEQLDEYTRQNIRPNSSLVHEHLEALKEMVRIDSRSFGVNEFSGDRTDPSDMKEILDCAAVYLRRIGFDRIKINTPPTGPVQATPILLAEIIVSSKKPTLLFYAHLDKQPYMDDGKFKKWGGVAPTELRWNSDRSRAYGRGAADDLSGVLAIGMATLPPGEQTELVARGKAAIIQKGKEIRQAKRIRRYRVGQNKPTKEQLEDEICNLLEDYRVRYPQTSHQTFVSALDFCIEVIDSVFGYARS